MILRGTGRLNEEGKELKFILIAFEENEKVPAHLEDKVVNKALMIQVPYEGDNKFSEETNLIENINIAARIIFDIKESEESTEKVAEAEAEAPKVIKKKK